MLDENELLFDELYEKTKNCSRVQFIKLLMEKERENQELKKKLGEQQYYKFYKYDNNPDGSDYCYCERPCDDNMSLRCFLENGEILGFMSETLVSAYDNIKEITMSDFMFEFVKPLIKENYIMRTQQQEFIEWLEDMLVSELDIFTVVRVCDVLSKYKEIIGNIYESDIKRGDK